MAQILRQLVLGSDVATSLKRARWAAEKLDLHVRKDDADGFRATKDWWKRWPCNLTVKATPHGDETLLAASFSYPKLGYEKFLEGRGNAFVDLMGAPFG